MPEVKKTIVFYEGDDDKAFLEQLNAASLLPRGWELAKREKNQSPGKDGLIRQLLPVVSPVNGIDGRAVALIDLDDHTPEKTLTWFREKLEKALKSDDKYAFVKIEPAGSKGRVQSMRLEASGRIGCVAVVPVGCPDDSELVNNYKIDRFAIDDWVLRLALDKTVFEQVSELKVISYEVAVKKYREVADLFRSNGLQVRKAKTYVQILRALAQIAPSTATLVGRLVKKGIEVLGKDEFVTRIQPFLDDLASADELVRAGESPDS